MLRIFKMALLYICFLALSGFANAVTETPQSAPEAVQPAAVETAAVSPEATIPPDIKVLEFVLTDKVEGREPHAAVETFNREQEKGMAYAFARLSTKKNTQVTFVWLREGREHMRFTTNVQPAKKWRTYSSVQLRPGNWQVQLKAGTAILAEQTFVVQ